LLSFVGFGEDVAESLHAVAPTGLELVEQAGDAAYGVDPAAYDSFAAALVLGDEVGSFEDGDVLLHGGETHRVSPSQVGHGVLAVQYQPNDVPAGRIGEGVEQPICLLVCLLCLCWSLIYNHMVVHYRMGG
jgi:hypothetical protein